MPYRLPLTWIRLGSASLIAAAAVSAIVLFQHGQEANQDRDNAVQLELHTQNVMLGGMRLLSALKVPQRRGFGSTVICNLIESSLGGEVTLDFADSGLVWQLRCPAREVVDDIALPIAS